MANIKTKKEASGWVISIRDLKLNTVLRTKTDNKNQAKRILTKIQYRINELKKNKDDEFYKYSLKEKRKYVKTGFRPVVPEKQKTLFSDATKEFLDHKRNSGLASQTIQGYEIKFAQAHEFFGDIYLEDLTNQKIQDFVFCLQKKRNKRGRNIGSFLDVSTQQKIVSHLRMLVSWHIAKKNIDQRTEIFKAIEYRAPANTELKKLTAWCDFEKRIEELDRYGISHDTENAFAQIIFSKEQLFELLDYLKTKLWTNGTVESRRFYAAVYFVAATGIRRSEIARVRKCDVYLEDREATIWLRKGRKQEELKSHRRYLPETVVPYLTQVLAELPKDQQSVFVNDDVHLIGSSFDEDEERKKADVLTRKLISAYTNSQWANAAGFHKFRHSLASILLIEGKSQTEVKETLGWCSDEMAQRYSHLAIHRKREIIESVFPSTSAESNNVSQSEKINL